MFSLLRGPPSDPLSFVSLFGSFPGRLSFCSRGRPLIGLGNFISSCGWCLPWGLPCSSLPSWFSGEASVFRSSSPLLFSVAVSSGFLWALLRPSAACVPFWLFVCASLVACFPSCPRSLFVSPRSPSCSLSPHAFSFFLCDILAGAFSSVSSSLPSAPCSSYSSVSPFSSSHPRSSLRAWVCGVLVFLRSAPLDSFLVAPSCSSTYVFLPSPIPMLSSHRPVFMIRVPC